MGKHFKVWLGNAACSVIENVLHAVIKFKFQMMSRKVEDFASNFDKTGLTWSVFRSVREALDFDPDLTEDNPLFKKILQPDAGEFLVPKHPANFSKVENSDPTAAPILGEHTEEILGDVLNLSDIEVSNLFDNGVVASPSFHKNK